MKNFKDEFFDETKFHFLVNTILMNFPSLLNIEEIDSIFQLC